MINKKILPLFLIATILLTIVVYAQTESIQTNTELSINTETGAGITPDSLLYGLKTFGEKIRLTFTFRQEAKANLELELANKKLLEAQKMADKGNLKAFERAQMRYEQLLASAHARLETSKEESDPEKVKVSAEGIIGLEAAIQVHEYKIDRIKDRMQNSNLTEEERAKFEILLERMSNRTAEIDMKLSQREEKIRTKLKTVTNKSEEEINSEIKDLEGRVNFTATAQIVAKARIDAAQGSLDKLKTRLANGELKVNVTIAQERIDLATSTIAQAQLLYDQGEYQAAIRIIKPFGNFGRDMSEMKKEMNEQRKNMKEDMKENLKVAQERAKEELQQAREKIKAEIKTNVQTKTSVRLGLGISGGAVADLEQ